MLANMHVTGPFSSTTKAAAPYWPTTKEASPSSSTTRGAISSSANTKGAVSSSPTTEPRLLRFHDASSSYLGTLSSSSASVAPSFASYDGFDAADEAARLLEEQERMLGEWDVGAAKDEANGIGSTANDMTRVSASDVENATGAISSRYDYSDPGDLKLYDTASSASSIERTRRERGTGINDPMSPVPSAIPRVIREGGGGRGGDAATAATAEGESAEDSMSTLFTMTFLLPVESGRFSQYF